MRYLLVTVCSGDNLDRTQITDAIGYQTKGQLMQQRASWKGMVALKFGDIAKVR
ncbi:hypothetical protein ACQ4WP_15935 [Janthinobacterium sp. GB4P2]|uniref:hypothetical protein n=1 Tax=Janthinobacterium sp. GB4P2 TaxID=3424189 RepID=UPI003F27C2C4